MCDSVSTYWGGAGAVFSSVGGGSAVTGAVVGGAAGAAIVYFMGEQHKNH